MNTNVATCIYLAITFRDPQPSYVQPLLLLFSHVDALFSILIFHSQVKYVYMAAIPSTLRAKLNTPREQLPAYPDGFEAQRTKSVRKVKLLTPFSH